MREGGGDALRRDEDVAGLAREDAVEVQREGGGLAAGVDDGAAATGRGPARRAGRTAVRRGRRRRGEGRRAKPGGEASVFLEKCASLRPLCTRVQPARSNALVMRPVGATQGRASALRRAVERRSRERRKPLFPNRAKHLTQGCGRGVGGRSQVNSCLRTGLLTREPSGGFAPARGPPQAERPEGHRFNGDLAFRAAHHRTEAADRRVRRRRRRRQRRQQHDRGRAWRACEFVVANTDAQQLQFAKTDKRIQLGVAITQGLGAGAHPEVGMSAAEEIDPARSASTSTAPTWCSSPPAWAAAPAPARRRSSPSARASAAS